MKIKRIELKIHFILIVFLFVISNVYGQKRMISFGNSDPNCCLTYELYKAKRIGSLNELPQNIKSKVENHLLERFGNDYYYKLKFISAEIIDTDELFRIEPKFKDYKWKIHSYEFVFNYTNPQRGLKEFFARIRLDSNGDVIQEIDLPEVKKFPQKADLIPVDKAVEIAKSKGFKPKKIEITILYDGDSDSLVWSIKSFAYEDKYTITDKVIKIDAHSAEILKEGYEGGIK